MMRISQRWIGAVIAPALLVIFLSCKREKPKPPQPTPARLGPTTTTMVLPTPSRRTPAPAGLTTDTAARTAPVISPEVLEVFEQLDRAFANSKSRDVSLRARTELLSSVKNFRANVAVEMKLQFPNLMNVRGVNETKSNDPRTTTGWVPATLNWGYISDGEKMFLKKGFAITQEAPATLDDVLTQQIELPAWGESALLNCFLRTKPSTAFMHDLVRARIQKRTAEQIDIELVTKPPLSVRQRAEIPESFTITQLLSIDAKWMIPKRVYIDLVDLRHEFHRIRKQPGVKIEKAFYEFVATSVQRQADFSGKDYFVIPPEALKSKRGGAGPGLLAPTTGPLSPMLRTPAFPTTPLLQLP